MIQELIDVYNEFSKPLDELNGSEGDPGRRLKYRQLFIESIGPFSKKLHATAIELEHAGLYKKEAIESEVKILFDKFHEKF